MIEELADFRELLVVCISFERESYTLLSDREVAMIGQRP